ncbi:MAG: GNAT family N-acetyltransferase [candidate division WOR-3 bacterium]|nr:MAG: GNAT family N-acetyltransferase [candidate division WOR-3 bacterium]
MIGLKKGTLNVVPYDPEWATFFSQEKQKILDAVGQYMVAIEHIGSTAVKGIWAKPIIDIAIGLKAYEDGFKCVGPLEEIGYVYKGEFGIAGRHYFRTDADIVTCHVHMHEVDSESYKNYILFRDYLRVHKEAASVYSVLKKDLMKKHRDDRNRYTKAKADFINEVIQKARAEHDTIDLDALIQGTSVCLRPVTLKDASIIRKWHNDPELIQLARIGREKTTLKQERADIQNARKSKDQAYHIIVKQSDDTAIGFVRFNFIDRTSGNVWLRVMIGEKAAWGKGYARDALETYLRWLFDDIGIHRVTLECYSTNMRAVKFYERLGFNKEGVLREAVLIDGTYHDVFSFGLLKRDFTVK